MAFEPKILGFLCNWCSYAGADLAGVSRIQYPTNVRIIRVMCSGRVDPVFIAEAFINGIDGVIVLGCHLGDCHYISGNYEAELKMKMVSKAMSMINFADRVRLDWVSAAEGNRFAQIISDFTDQIRKLGPSPTNNKKLKKQIVEKLNAVKCALADSRLRAFVARQRELTTEGNVYGKIIPNEEFEEILNDAIENEIIRHEILEKIKNKGKSVPDIAKEIEVEPHKVLQHIVTLRARGLVDVDQINEEIPTFISIKGV
jgi:F420-non-reducing hydrogenase iron-sulfur subunit